MTHFKTLLLAAIVATGGLSACSSHSGAGAAKIYASRDSVQIPNDTIPDSIKLSLSVAGLYVKNYGGTAGLLKAGPEQTANTRCFWVSLKRLNAMVAKLNREHGDGMRLYFAAYDTTYQPGFKNPPKKEYWGHNTLVIVSTKDSTVVNEHFHSDYYKDLNASQNTGLGGFILTVPENRGEICPPPSNCAAEGAYLLSNQ